MWAGGSYEDQLARLAVTQLPQYVVLGCGFLLAHIRRRRHARAAFLVALGTGLLLFNSAGTFLLYSWRMTTMSAKLASVFALAQTALTAVGYALLIAAAFVDRTRAYGESSAAMPDAEGT
ncbi:MAG: hypothetical protein U0746_10720 [Gemmataceae bacterium]